MMRIIALLLVFQQAGAIEKALQNVISTASYLSTDTAINLGVVTPSNTVALAAGLKERQKHIKLQPEDRLGLGSGTKMYTWLCHTLILCFGRALTNLWLNSLAPPFKTLLCDTSYT
jgi:hypothetical protein